MKMIGKTLKWIIRVVLALVLLLAVALGVFTAAEYRPADRSAVSTRLLLLWSLR